MTISTSSTLRSDSSTEIKDIKGTFQLVKLSPEYINQEWTAIEYAISESLPPTSHIEYENMLLEIQKVLMSELAECWLLVSNNEPHILWVSFYSIDFLTKEKTLVVYSMYGYKKVPDSLWLKLMSTVEKIAKKEGCKKMVTTSASERVLAIVKILGWNTEYRLLTKEI